MTTPTRKAAIERCEGMCTASSIAYEVIASNGYCVQEEGEHVVAFDTLREAKQAMRHVRPCPCNQCTQPTRSR